MENIRAEMYMTKYYQIDAFIKFSGIFDYVSGDLDSILVNRLLRLGHLYEITKAVGTT